MAVPRVRVRVRRSGGFAGVPMDAEADSDRLDPADADRLRHLVARAELDAPPAHSGVVPDSLRYEVDVWRESEHVHLTARDPGLPAGLRDLLGWLQTRAQPGGRRSP
jgi:hypothetical protein